MQRFKDLTKCHDTYFLQTITYSALGGERTVAPGPSPPIRIQLVFPIAVVALAALHCHLLRDGGGFDSSLIVSSAILAWKWRISFPVCHRFCILTSDDHLLCFGGREDGSARTLAPPLEFSVDNLFFNFLSKSALAASHKSLTYRRQPFTWKPTSSSSHRQAPCY